MNFADISFLLAQDAAPAPVGGGGGMMIPMMVLMMVMFYFVLIRPQRKQQKEQQKMRDSLAVGDEIVTIGGLHGKVARKDTGTVILKLEDGTKMKFDRSAIASTTKKKGEPDAPVATDDAQEVEAEVIK